MKRLIAVLTVLVGCSHQAPVSVVYDINMPAACQTATLEAVAFWNEHTALTVSAGELVGEPELGEVWVRYAPQEIPGEAGHAFGAIRDGVPQATIVLAECRGQTVAHEIGHTLGLGHVDDATNLMYTYKADGWLLVDEQMENLND